MQAASFFPARNTALLLVTVVVAAIEALPEHLFFEADPAVSTLKEEVIISKPSQPTKQQLILARLNNLS